MGHAEGPPRDGDDGTPPPPGPDGPPGTPENRGTGSGGGRSRRLGRLRAHWGRWLALSLGLVVLVVAGAGWVVFERLNGNIRTDSGAEAELERHAAERPPPSAHRSQNILVIGTDSRSGANGAYGHDNGTQRADTVILLHLAGGRHSATAVSIPRDLMVPVPACGGAGGSGGPAGTAQFNSAFERGGAACVIRTVEGMTGLRVDHHLVIDFTGFKHVVDAVDGVRVCVRRPMRDPRAHLDLRAGTQRLDGDQALGFVRSRHVDGDGSDTERIGRQQEFLAALAAKVKSDGVLLNPGRLYPVLDAATRSVVADPGLDSLSRLYDLVASLRHTPSGRIRFLTVPREPYTADRDRDQLLQPAAGHLFAALRADRLPPGGGRPSPRPSTGATAGTGSTTAAGVCGAAH
ncbi:LCP family protein [Streptomyces sp. SL13]|uniref:LCP family protein n=1 Tax=Streptantibioticus silvisoli TaxID=2705255 RepID=A0AA90KIE4_9ACTN|nr:LCP family protein [Streptantibioticus silvisoli]MDI5965212.1 LCP family protein [Streptantibioticus silvisoli]MDI5973005.1 LCP family protein [Streptantibioticus silvisoli]